MFEIYFKPTAFLFGIEYTDLGCEQGYELYKNHEINIHFAFFLISIQYSTVL